MTKPFKINDVQPRPQRAEERPDTPVELLPPKPLPTNNEGGFALGKSTPIKWPQPVPGVAHTPFKGTK